jgi:hypothetical protein
LATATDKSTATKKTTSTGSKSLDDYINEVGKKTEEPKKTEVKLVALTQSDIVNAMKAVQPKINACANQFKTPGTAMATISVAAGGKVGSATVTGRFAGSPTGACIEQAARTAKFPACQAMSFPWPFTLTPR